MKRIKETLGLIGSSAILAILLAAFIAVGALVIMSVPYLLTAVFGLTGWFGFGLSVFWLLFCASVLMITNEGGPF